MKVLNSIKTCPGRRAEKLLKRNGFECYNTGCLGTCWKKNKIKINIFWHYPDPIAEMEWPGGFILGKKQTTITDKINLEEDFDLFKYRLGTFKR
jgi:hypothetical protein